MKRIVLIGLDPATVDSSDPALPPGMTAEKVHAGVKLVLADFAARGWHGENCFINPDETSIVPRQKRPSPSTPALKIAVRQLHAGSDTLIRAPSRCGSP